jgi:hypothetical protein
VIRQSAKHLKGRNAIVGQGGVDPHTSSGPIPVFVFSGYDSQAGKDRGQQLTDGRDASATTCPLMQHVGDNLYFATSRWVG